MNVEPQKEHQWLQKLVGEWTFECAAGEEKSAGTDTVRSLGALWIVAEGSGSMPGGGPGTWMLTLGYDPQGKHFTGTWIGSMMTHMWVYEGNLDASGRLLTLDCEGPSMAGDGKIAKYRDIVEIVNENERLLRAEVQNEDGTWNEFMRMTYRRK